MLPDMACTKGTLIITFIYMQYKCKLMLNIKYIIIISSFYCPAGHEPFPLPAYFVTWEVLAYLYHASQTGW